MNVTRMLEEPKLPSIPLREGEEANEQWANVFLLIFLILDLVCMIIMGCYIVVKCMLKHQMIQNKCKNGIPEMIHI